MEAEEFMKTLLIVAVSITGIILASDFIIFCIEAFVILSGDVIKALVERVFDNGL